MCWPSWTGWKPTSTDLPLRDGVLITDGGMATALEARGHEPAGVPAVLPQALHQGVDRARRGVDLVVTGVGPDRLAVVAGVVDDDPHVGVLAGGGADVAG